MKTFDKGFHPPIYVTRPLLPDLDKVMAKLQEVWDAKWLTNNGHQHQVIESQLKKTLKVPNLSLFNNGTTALIAACRVLGLTGEVITTPFTFAATPHALSINRLTPVFCDIDPDTMNINPAKIEELITPRTSAILAVHVFGTPCDVLQIQDIANRHSLKVIYDGAHVFQTEIEGVGIGNYGDMTMFSFHATKLFHTIEGGALAFTDPNLKEKLDRFRNFGIVHEESVQHVGLNGKMNEVQAIMGQLVLEMIEEERNRRRILAETYRKCLENVQGIYFLPELPNVKPSYQYFIIRIIESEFGLNRDQVYERLKQYNVHPRKYFHPLCSSYDCYRHLPSSSPEKLPVAQQIASEVLSMPFYGELSVQDVETICDLIVRMKK